MQTNLIKNNESLLKHRSSQAVRRRSKKTKALVTTNDERKTANPLYGYIKNVILSAFLNKTPNLSSFYNFSIDKRPVKGYHVFNTKTKMQ